MSEIPFNLNESVKVKLTPLGISILRDRREALNKHIKERGGQGLGQFELKVDDEGYTTFQLWNLMEIFGPYVGLARENPFDLNIKLVEVMKREL